MKRRKFLTNSALLGSTIPLGVATPAILSSCTGNSKKRSTASFTPEELGMFSFVETAPDGAPLKAALIGCGDRGTGAAVNFLSAGPNLEIIALADLFPDRMERCRTILAENNNKVDDSNCFFGFDAYQKVMAMPEVELVLLCTPTHFRPEQFKAAIEARTCVLKPCAVDPTESAR